MEHFNVVVPQNAINFFGSPRFAGFTIGRRKTAPQKIKGGLIGKQAGIQAWAPAAEWLGVSVGSCVCRM
jgi:hypothetical protein